MAMGTMSKSSRDFTDRSELESCGETTFQHGKYDGKKVKECPLEYLEWYSKNVSGFQGIDVSKYLTHIRTLKFEK